MPYVLYLYCHMNVKFRRMLSLSEVSFFPCVKEGGRGEGGGAAAVERVEKMPLGYSLYALKQIRERPSLRSAVE